MVEIPQWAIERAQNLFHCDQSAITPIQWRSAFARYIAAHEEAPPTAPVALRKALRGAFPVSFRDDTCRPLPNECEEVIKRLAGYGFDITPRPVSS